MREKLTQNEIALRTKARDAVRNAIKLGKFDKGLRCQYCGETKNLQAHHYKGYEKEHWFDVEWVCSKCHSIIHDGDCSGLRKKKQITCIVCGRPARRLNLCETHRTRLRRYGNPFLKREKIGSDWQIVEEYYASNIPTGDPVNA